MDGVRKATALFIFSIEIGIHGSKNQPFYTLASLGLQIMAGKVIVLTGTTSSVGSATLEHLLATGKSVNAVIRSAAKYQALILEKYKDYVRSGKLLLTEIPDMCVPHAFDRIAKSAEV